MSDTDIKTAVREIYGRAARHIAHGVQASCCEVSGALTAAIPITSNLYTDSDQRDIPSSAVAASLGCGNPTALAKLTEGDVVLDLGSGGGIDVLLSARRVGPTGKAYGLDMTHEMIALARSNLQKSGLKNAEFLKGEIENVPLPDASIDVIISNCVINLSADKDRVFAEAFRVLKPGGRLAISDIVTSGAFPDELRRDLLLWAGCIAGALDESELKRKLAAVGFDAIEVEPTRIYTADDAREMFGNRFKSPSAPIDGAHGKVMSAFVRATKPR